MSIAYLFVTRNISVTPSIKIIPMLIEQKSLRRTKPNAFIITADCNSTRYNVTKKNIEERFPNFFNIICFRSIPLNDSRINVFDTLFIKKLTSNMLTFIELWSYEIPKYSEDNEYQWSFIFEDDINFLNPVTFFLTNLTGPVEEIMNNRGIQMNDGFFYLGICAPTYSNDDPPILLQSTNDGIISRKGYGFCLHASAITAKRAKLFWTEISSYRPGIDDRSLDHQLREFCQRSKTTFYTVGANMELAPGTGHYGIAFQDRGRFESTVVEPEN